jgi:hypothetical protein
LNASQNKIGGWTDKQGITQFADALVANASIRHLDFSFTNLNANDMKCFKECLKQNSTLQYINISGTVVGDDGKEAMGKVGTVGHRSSIPWGEGVKG